MASRFGSLVKLPNLADLADEVLDRSIVGSFTKLGFAARSKVFDLGDWDGDLVGQRALVTGASSGIGRAVAEGLLELGADVVVTSRSLGRAEVTADSLNVAPGDPASNPQRGVAQPMALDTGEFDSIGIAVEALRSGPQINMVCHNAGALTDEYRVTSRGMEATLASHLVGPYALTRALRPHLVLGARVIWMASGGMYSQKLDVDRIEMRRDNYRGSVAYAIAKRAQVELVTQLGPEWAPEVIMHAMHPGWVDTPGVDASLPVFAKVTGPLLRSAEQGADTMVWLAATGGITGVQDAKPGQFWLDRKPRGTSYVPGTSVTSQERARLVNWLDLESDADWL